MTTVSTPVARAGYSDAPQGTERAHILIVQVEERPGSVDRVVGVLRRKRAHVQSLSLGRSDASSLVRITAQVKDTDVSVDNLVEQLRKVVDVHEVTNLTPAHAVMRELALIKVKAPDANLHELVEAAHQAGAALVDVTDDTVIFEVVGSEEKLAHVMSVVQPYGVRDVARSGCVVMARGAGEGSEG